MGRQVFVDYFSLIVRHEPKKLHKVDSSLEKVFPRVLGKCVLFLLRRTRTSSKIRCVLKRVNFARSERIAFLYFSTGRSLLFSREQIFERIQQHYSLGESEAPNQTPIFHRSVALDYGGVLHTVYAAVLAARCTKLLNFCQDFESKEHNATSKCNFLI